jgi:hypothetical protein
MRDYVFAKKISCPSARQLVKASKKTANSTKNHLLVKLLLELEVVKEGDTGDISLLDNNALLITQKFNKMVDEIVELTDPRTSFSGHSDKDYAEKPGPVELILTGRYCPPELIERADLVTEMLEIKHYYQEGVAARKGIEF